MTSKPHVLILGGNFAGLESTQKIRDLACDRVNITVIGGSKNGGYGG